MYLEQLIGTKTKINALSVLINNPEKKFIETQLAIEADAALSVINKQMNDLVQVGLVVMEKIGKSKVYSINKKHFLKENLERLFKNINETYIEAAKKITNYSVKVNKSIECIMLFGSAAQKNVKNDFLNNPSDLDIIIITKKIDKKFENELIGFINEEITQKYGFISHPIILTEKEYLKALANRLPQVLKSHAQALVLYGRKPRQFS